MNDLQIFEEEIKQKALNYLKQCVYSGPIVDTTVVTTSNFTYYSDKYISAYDTYGYDPVLQKKRT